MQVNKLGRNSLWIILFVTVFAAAEEVLSQEFLEYLANFETENGEWVDPEDLEIMAHLGDDSDDKREVVDDN